MMTYRKLSWVNTNPGAPRDEHGYWISQEGRFRIAPNYRHTVNPSHFTVTDILDKADCSLDTIRECKDWAAMRAAKTVEAAF